MCKNYQHQENTALPIQVIFFSKVLYLSSSTKTFYFLSPLAKTCYPAKITICNCIVRSSKLTRFLSLMWQIANSYSDAHKRSFYSKASNVKSLICLYGDNYSAWKSCKRGFENAIIALKKQLSVLKRFTVQLSPLHKHRILTSQTQFAIICPH